MTLRYTKDHEWIKVDGDTATVGISVHAQEALGDVVFVEVPAVGTVLKKGGEAAVVESVKAASEVYAPISGEVIEANTALEAAPGTVNEDPLGAGWFFKIKIADAADLIDLMDEASYEVFLASGH